VSEPLVSAWLGRVPYADAALRQDELVAARRRGAAPDTLLLLEHPKVITLGRGADPAHVLADEAALRASGTELHECSRGGDVTFHGPGQLVGWPVIALRPERRDVHRYLRDLESALIALLADFGIEGGRIPGLTGVWSGGRKVAAIGVRLSSGWITSHGFALNVTTDLTGFDAIVPCGIADRGVTSLRELLGRDVALAAVTARAAERVAEALGYEAAASPAESERIPRGIAA